MNTFTVLDLLEAQTDAVTRSDVTTNYRFSLAEVSRVVDRVSFDWLERVDGAIFVEADFLEKVIQRCVVEFRE